MGGMREHRLYFKFLRVTNALKVGQTGLVVFGLQPRRFKGTVFS